MRMFREAVAAVQSVLVTSGSELLSYHLRIFHC